MIHFSREPGPYEIRRTIKSPEHIGRFCGNVAMEAFNEEWRLQELEGEPELITPLHIVLLDRHTIDEAVSQVPGDKRRRDTWRIHDDLRQMTKLMSSESVLRPDERTTILLEHDANGNSIFSVSIRDLGLASEQNICNKILAKHSSYTASFENTVRLPFAKIPAAIGKVAIDNEELTVEDHLWAHTNGVLREALPENGLKTLQPFMVLPPELVYLK